MEFQLLILGFAIALGDFVHSSDVKSDHRVVGGIETDISQYPYQLSLEFLGEHICGAALISPIWAITASHCVDGMFMRFLTVRAGSTHKGEGGKVVKVKDKIMHSNYNRKSIDYDIALLKLEELISEVYAKPIKLPKAGLILKEGIFTNVTGWGATSETGKLSKKLRVTEIPTVNQSLCQKIYGKKAITRRMFCAGISKGGKDSCQGDSGGPLVVHEVLYGVVSWGYGCARPGIPGVYTNISALRSFIKDVTGL